MKIKFITSLFAVSMLLVGSNNLYAAVTVEETLDNAFQFSPTLKSSVETVVAAGYDVNKAFAAYFPTIGVWANTGLVQDSDFATHIYQTESEGQYYAGAGISIRQILFAGGLNRAKVYSAETGLDYSENLLFDAATSLAFEALSAHADLARFYRLVDLSKENVKEHEQVLRTTKLRYNQGVITNGEVTQVESRLARARATLLSHETGLEAAKAAYYRIVGVQAPSELETLESPILQYTSSDSAIELADDFNARFLSTLDNIQFNEAEKSVAKSSFLPNIYAQGSYSTKYQEGVGNGNSHGYNVGLVLEWELFSGGADKANISKANANIRKAQYESQKFKDQLHQDITATYARVGNLFKQVDYYAQSMDYSRRTKNNFYQQFQAGQRGLLDVLDAESEYFASVVDREISQVDALIGQYRMLALVGTLLDELNIEKSDLLEMSKGL